MELLDTFNLKSAKDYNALLADRDNLKKQLEASENEVTNFKKMSEDYTAKIESFNQVEANYKQQITDLTEAHSKEIEKLKAESETNKKSAELHAQTIAATMGIPSEEKLPKVVEPAATLTVEQLLANASPKEKQDIFNKHKDEILKAQGISKELWESKFNK